MTKISLCGRPRACCPTVEFIDDETMEITDDYGGDVQLTMTEYHELQRQIEDKKKKTIGE